MPNCLVRLAEVQDAETVAALIRAMDAHYDAAGRASSMADTLAMVRHAVETREGTRFALAFQDGRPVGLACFALIRPGSRLKGVLFLKDLFVAEEARGRAVGRTILRWLADYARARGIGRIDLTAEAANRRAQAFYESLGGDRMDKVFYRFDLTGRGD